MHQIAFGSQALPRSAGGARSAPPEPLAVLGEGKGKDGKRRGGRYRERGAR